MKKILSIVAALVFTFSLVSYAQTSLPNAQNEVSVSGGSAYGTTGVYARTFTTVTQSVGSDITYTSDAVNGDSFTINHTGLYALSYTDGGGVAATVGVSINYSAASAWHLAWGTANELCAFTFGDSASSCSVVVYLSSGDVIRAHSDSLITNTSSIAKFVITEIR